MNNIAIFASGRGTNFEAIAKAVKNKTIKARLSLLVCDNPKAAVLAKAKKLKIETLVIERKKFPDKKAFESEIIKTLKTKRVDLIALAGYMRILSRDFIEQYKNRIINIHPSLLPAFKGTQAIKDAFDYGVKITGVSIHFVDEKMDNGPIILQGAIEIKENENLNSLEKRIHALEHKLYPKAINLVLKSRLKITGRKVKIS